jgi:hypothetical protein
MSGCVVGGCPPPASRKGARLPRWLRTEQLAAERAFAVVAGGFPDRCSLFTKSDGSVWVLDPINEVLNQVTPTVVRLGERLGSEERHEISPPPPWPVGAACSTTRGLFWGTKVPARWSNSMPGLPNRCESQRATASGWFRWAGRR